MNERSHRIVAYALLLLAAAACAAAADSLPVEYLGRWYYTGSSGGIAGTGIGDEPTGYIVIQADNTIDHFQDDGTLVSTTEFGVRLGKTIFAAEDMWVLTGDGGLEQAIQLSDDGSMMSLSENVYDGFGRSYARSR